MAGSAWSEASSFYVRRREWRRYPGMCIFAQVWLCGWHILDQAC